MNASEEVFYKLELIRQVLQETNSAAGVRLRGTDWSAWATAGGSNIEDTFVLNPDNSLENLSFDSKFPHIEIAGRLRPDPLERQ